MHKARKRFGQNFLMDDFVLQQMIDAIHPKDDEHFVEIGPGKGVLTEKLLPLVKKLEVIEIDRDLIYLLQKKFNSSNSLIIHSGDVLDFNWSLLLSTDKYRVVGNLPYNISTPLLFKMFDDIQRFEDFHFLLQKEVVDRLTAEVGSHDYGRLSVMSQYYCQNIFLFTVPPEAFQPQPKVTSAFVRMTPYKPEILAQDINQLSNVVREAFCYRRKTISNALKNLISESELKDLNIDVSKRPQELSVSEYIYVSNHLSKKRDILLHKN